MNRSPRLRATAFLVSLFTLQLSHISFAQWTPTTVDIGVDPASVGAHASLAVVNGNPAISYYDSANFGLKYVRATDASGTAWGEPVAIDAAESVGLYTSLAVVNGNPAISYFDIDNTALKFVRATDANGTAWGTPVTVDAGPFVGHYTSLAVVDGNPAISYFDYDNLNLKYVRATSATGASPADWGAPIAIDATGDVGQFNSLTVVNGSPAISYYDATNANDGDLKYVRATNSTGALLADWGAPVAIDTAGDVGQYTSLEVVNGNPAISYYDVTNRNLKYVRATNDSGALLADWGAPVSVDTAADVGQHTSLEVVNGNPAISYHDLTNVNNGDLKYVRATNATGELSTDWSTPITIDSSGDSGQYTSLAIVNGNPMIAYYDRSAGRLKFVHATNTTGVLLADWSAPVTIKNPGVVGLFTSLAVVNGNPAISYYDFTNGNLNYARATDDSGTAWDAPVSVDTAGDVGWYSSLAIVSGNPAISYLDLTDGNLKYIRSTNTVGSSGSWPAFPVVIDSSGFVGLHTSLAVVFGNPAIAYQDANNGYLNYVRATNATGATLANWGTPVAIDTAAVVGEYASLAVVNGNPAVAYYDSTNGDLKYVRASSANPMSAVDWFPPIAIDTVGDVGWYTSLAVVDGNPAISYWDRTNGDLKYVRATNANGSLLADWGAPPITIDTTGDVGQYTSLEVVNGHPAISYYDLTNPNDGDLKYVSATNATGATLADWGAPLTIDMPGDVGQYTSLAVVNSNPAISYYDATTFDLKYAIGLPPPNAARDWKVYE
jgi:hypothetical protein